MAVARLAFALGKTGAVSEAEAEARKAEAILRPLVDKENPAATDLQNYAYLLAEGPGAGVRLGLKALPYADKAVKLTKESDPLVMLTFAQAHGAARDFAEAIRWAEKALAKTPADQPPMREQIEAELAKFRAAAGK